MTSLAVVAASTTAGATAKTTSDTEDDADGALFVLCSVDGAIYSLDAWTGQLRSSSRTGVPLITRSQQKYQEETEEDADTSTSRERDPFFSSGMIHPGLDGKLYWQSNNNNNNNNDDDTQPLQALPVSVPSLLDHPVRSCTDDGLNCGVLTAVAHNTLLALDTQTGAVEWTSSVLTGKPSSSSTTSTVLLQRKDFAIQHISTKSGRQIWNVTLGSYQAVDFGDTQKQKQQNHPSSSPQPRHDSPRIDDDDDLEDDFMHDEQQEHTISLPWLRFAKGGRELIALLPMDSTSATDTKDATLLWRIEAPHVLTAVFGIHNHRWKAVQVLDELEDTIDTFAGTLRLPSSPQYPDHQASIFWQQQQQQQQCVHHFLPSPPIKPRQYPPGEKCPNMWRRDLLRLPGPPVQSPLLSEEHVTSEKPTSSSLWAGIGIGMAVTLMAAAVVLYNRPESNNGALVAQIVVPPQPSLRLDNTTTPEVITSSVSFPGAIRRRCVTTYMDDLDTPKALEDTTSIAPTGAQSDPGGESPQEAAASSIPRVQYSRYASEFTELRALGRGGFGSVFMCRNNLDGREYAMKKVAIRANHGSDLEQELSRVLREVKILAVLDHPHIVRYYTAWLETTHQDEEEDGDSKITKDQSFSTAQSFTRSLDVRKGRYDESESESESSFSRRNGWSSSKNDPTSSSAWSRRGGNGGRVSWKQQQAVASWGADDDDDDCGIIFEDSSKPDSAEGGGGGGDKGLSRSRGNPLPQISESQNASSSEETPKPPHGDTNTNSVVTPNDASLPPLKHTLYIQMQLCRFDTVADFLVNEKARKPRQNNTSSAVDIPAALGLFVQIAKAVHHVHERGLIHRDLKPSNCFMDEAGIVKVGDFGLSRETSADSQEEDAVAAALMPFLGDGDDDENNLHTAGVGTRMYASPEQTEGSSYDASTDVYSLGIILFELCYPMYTGMERNICLTKLRQQGHFPSDWDTIVGSTYSQALRNLIQSMLQPNPSLRPKAAGVVQQLKEHILGELTILSPQSYARTVSSNTTSDDLSDEEPILLLRVESTCQDNAMLDAIGHIQAVAPKATILQSGMAMRLDGTTKVTILEFALSCGTDTNHDTTDGILAKLNQVEHFQHVRQVSAHSHLPPSSPMPRRIRSGEQDIP